MLFATLVLVSVNGEHNRLEEGVDLGHGDESTQMGDVSGLRLQEKQEIAVLLCLIIVRENAVLLGLGGILETARDFVLLRSNPS